MNRAGPGYHQHSGIRPEEDVAYGLPTSEDSFLALFRVPQVTLDIRRGDEHPLGGYVGVV